MSHESIKFQQLTLGFLLTWVNRKPIEHKWYISRNDRDSQEEDIFSLFVLRVYHSLNNMVYKIVNNQSRSTAWAWWIQVTKEHDWCSYFQAKINVVMNCLVDISFIT